jgi:hypothetical protein
MKEIFGYLHYTRSNISSFSQHHCQSSSIHAPFVAHLRFGELCVVGQLMVRFYLVPLLGP